MEKLDIIGVSLDNFTMPEALQKAKEIILAGKPGYMAFLNVSQLVFCMENEQLHDCYRNAQMVLVDGTNITRLAKILHTPVKEKIYGNDFIYEVCKMASENDFSVFFLGGAPGGAEQAVEKIRKASPQLKLAGTYAPPYGFENDVNEMNRINEMLKASKADLLFVGLGSPKQDYFNRDNKEKYGIAFSIPIGSGIDITRDVYKRAPRWVSEIGLEWLYRCCQEPKRLFKRYFTVIYKVGKYYRKYKKSK